MSLSVQDCISEYWKTRRRHAMGKARVAKRQLSVFQELMVRGHCVEEEVHQLSGERDLWVDQARRCNRALVEWRSEASAGRAGVGVGR